MESLYHQTNKLIQQVQDGFNRLGKCSKDEEDQVHLVENQIQSILDQIASNCEKLDILVSKEPPTRRRDAKLKVDQLKYDCQHLQAALRNIQHQHYIREREKKEREELLSFKFKPNDQDTSIAMDYSIQMNSSLNNAHRGMDDMIGSGSSILTNLRDQRHTLKGAHKRILDVANTLGMSNTVMRLIERRAFQDKFILFGGMIFTCLFMFLIYFYIL